MECERRHHTVVEATHRCSRCHRAWCRDCTHPSERLRGAVICPDCEGLASELPPSKGSFYGGLAETLKYPLEGSGFVVIVGGAILLAALDFLAAFSIIGWIAGFIGLGYFLAYYARVVESSANGDRELPDWPELHWGDLFAPVGRAGAVLIAAFGPGLALYLSGAESLGMAAALVGFAVAPMAWLSVSLHQSVWGLNPAKLISGMVRVPLQYLATFLVVLAVTAISTTVEATLGATLIGLPLAYLVGLYGTFVAMRALGLLYHHHEAEFDWFGEASRAHVPRRARAR